MMIYATPYDRDTLKTTGLSVDSGFNSLDDVVEALGPPDHFSHPRWFAYGETAFSDFPFNLGERYAD